MDFRTRIKEKENLLLYGRGKTKKPKTLYEIADHVGKSSSYLSRIGNLNEEVPFPIELAVKIMNFKKDYELLKFIASECGGVFIKIPKTKLAVKDENNMVAKYNKTASEAVNSLAKFIAEPTQSNFRKCEESLRKIIEESSSVKFYVNKKVKSQMELF